MERLKTGNDELDHVLRGGFPLNSINLIMGAPGTGKTILAEQLVFANATDQSPALYLTTLSEPLEKFISNGQEYKFFKSDKVGGTVLFEDLGFILRQRGITALPEVTSELLAKIKPRVLVIDSFKALNELMNNPQERRNTLFDFATLLSTYQCTTFLVGEYAGEMMTDLPEFAIADVVLQLMKYSTNVSEQRFLRVEKLRGSYSIPGMHAFSIDREGIEVFPRLLTPTVSPNYSAKVERVDTGIANLDGMIAEGFWRGSTTLIAGPTGSGKTIIGLHFITQGALKGEQGLYVGFQENPTQLSRVMKNLGWQPEKLLNGGGFDLLYRSPVELQADTVTSEIFRRVRDGKVRRVVIDALGDLERSSVDRQRFADFIYALTQWFAAENVTCLMMYELTNLFEVHGISDQEISNMADNVILLRFTPGPEMQRTLRIIKTRGSAHDNREHELQITNKGVVVKKA